MKRFALFFGLMLLAPGGTLSAQTIINAEDVTPKIGDVQELLVETAQQSLSALGIGVGEAGGPQVFDLSQAPQGTTASGVVITEVLPRGNAPGYEQYPQADYAVRMQGLEGMQETYFFVQETPAGSKILGFGGGAATSPLDDLFTQASQSGSSAWANIYPLTFGKKFEPVQIPLNFDTADLQMSGAMTLEGEVDAWGTVVVPAGRFEALRLHHWGKGSITVAASGQDTVRLAEEIEQYIWMSPRVGEVAMIQETRVIPPAEMGVPITTICQIYRLKSFQSGITASLSETWGQIKAEW